MSKSLHTHSEKSCPESSPCISQEKAEGPSPEDVLPSNICKESQLSAVPKECLSGNKERPLLHVNDLGHTFHYALQPMMYSVIFILIVELVERFVFYGIYYTQTLYLTGAYDADWNAGFAPIKASQFVSASTMIAYSTPFIGAFLADTLWGDYKAILVGLLFFYLPGVVLLALSAIPHLLGDEFNGGILTLSVLFLLPLGTGAIKSIVNVFGAKQFHPLLQSSLIESYYVNFYMCINIGALAGIMIVPVLAQYSIRKAYLLPCILLALGVLLFILGTPRYVCSTPRGGFFSSSKSDDNRIEHNKTLRNISLLRITYVCLLVVPFNIGYSQMPTTFIVQGMVMTKAFGFFDVGSMGSLDAMSVLLFGYITASFIYPSLASRGIKIKTSHKFAIGSGLGALAMLWARFVEYKIHSAYKTDGSQINLLWQAPAYLLIGWGEIFAVSASYEVAFTASSPDNKVLASAINIFCVGGLPNFICLFLYYFCSPWFQNDQGENDIIHIEDYATAKIGNYFWVLFGIMIFGVVINIMPNVRNFVASVEEQAVDTIRTPVLRKTPKNVISDEESALLSPQTNGGGNDQTYSSKFGNGPVLYKIGSMRAGSSLSKKATQSNKIKYKYVPNMYKSDK